MVKAKSFIEKFYVAFIGFLLYAPLLVLFVCSFNDSKSRTVWGGFTLHWYTDLFQNEEVLSAVRTSLLLTTLAALIATLIGTLACIGMTAMKLRFQKVMEGLSNIPLLNADIVTGVAIMLLFVHFMSLGFTSMLIEHVTLGFRCIRSIRLCQSCPAGNYPGNPFRIFLAFTVSMDDFVVTYFTKGAGINTISTMLYQQLRRGINPQMYALSTLLFLTILILLGLINHMSATKQKKADREEDR